MAYDYPQVDFKTIYPILKLLLAAQKDRTLISDSPYSSPIKDAILELLSTATDYSNTQTSDLRELDVESETIRLYENMRNIEISGKLDEKEKISLIKLQTATLQDLLNMVKESKEIKKIREFEDLIFGILTDEQKEKVKKLFS